MSSFTMLFFTLFFFFLVTVQGLQINFKNSEESNIIRYEQQQYMVKDTAQAHYESIIDDILSQHNEGLLVELSYVIKDPQQMYAVMKPQADILYGLERSSQLQDVCVAQMPGMIANQIHELSNEIYTSVDSIVNQFWKTTDNSYRQLLLNSIREGSDQEELVDELANYLEVINMDITEHIIQTVNNFQMLNKLKQSLFNCQAIFNEEEEEQDEETTLSEKIWHAVLTSFHLSNPLESSVLEQHSFMGKYISDLTSDIQEEMYARIYDLSKSIYEDLSFSSSSSSSSSSSA